MKTYRVNLHTRKVGSLGAYFPEWHTLEMPEMSSGAAIAALHRMTNGGHEVQNVNTIMVVGT